MSDASLYAVARTLFGRFGGGLSEVRPDDLVAAANQGVLAKAPGLDLEKIGDVVWRCANQAGEDNRDVGRTAVLLSGVAVSVVDPEVVNTKGGAIAIGHRLGASGGRLLGTPANRLRESGDRWGVAASCIGVGQALAVVLENGS